MALVPFAPRGLVRTVAEVARWSIGTTELLISLPGRISILLDRVEVLIARIEGISENAETVVPRVDAVAEAAAMVVMSAARTSETAQNLVELYEPLAERAAPAAKQFVEDLSQQEIHAAIGLVNHLPELTLRMEALLPILATMDTVSPEIHQLLEEVKNVRAAIQGVPGFNFLRKRGEEKADADDETD